MGMCAQQGPQGAGGRTGHHAGALSKEYFRVRELLYSQFLAL
jgi:hypothetical protein